MDVKWRQGLIRNKGAVYPIDMLKSEGVKGGRESEGIELVVAVREVEKENSLELGVRVSICGMALMQLLTPRVEFWR